MLNLNLGKESKTCSHSIYLVRYTDTILVLGNDKFDIEYVLEILNGWRQTYSNEYIEKLKNFSSTFLYNSTPDIYAGAVIFSEPFYNSGRAIYLFTGAWVLGPDTGRWSIRGYLDVAADDEAVLNKMYNRIYNASEMVNRVIPCRLSCLDVFLLSYSYEGEEYSPNPFDREIHIAYDIDLDAVINTSEKWIYNSSIHTALQSLYAPEHPEL